jgi:hypothetical protein
VSAATLRRWHSYIGLFIAPSVIFFALTGTVQLFGLHEEHGTYKPWAIVEKLSSVHKDQAFVLGNHHAPPAPEKGVSQPDDTTALRSAQKDEGDEPGVPTVILKVVFLVVALGLTLSAALGLWIGLTQTRMKRTAWILVISGTLTPVAFLML